MRWFILSLVVLTISVVGFSITDPITAVGRLVSNDSLAIESAAHNQIARVSKCEQPSVVYKHRLPAHMDRMMVNTPDNAKYHGRKTCIVKTF